MTCDNCGSTDFTEKIRPTLTGETDILQCDYCGKWWIL